MVRAILADEAGLTILPEMNGTQDLTLAAKLQEQLLHNPERRLREAPFVGSDLPDDAYGRIADILREQQGFDLEGYKTLCIKRRLAGRIRSVGCNDTEDYIALLLASQREQEQLLAALSIHVSQFFRNPSAFYVLDQRVLPELLEISRDTHSKLRIWSVGCANGEEPYSLALLCLNRVRKGEQLSIVGTDLSPEALKRARKGVFPAERVAEVPAELLSEYFTREGNDYQLCDRIRERVQFFRHDILSDQPFYRADLILCRNLLIYFSREQQQRIIGILAESLLPGGYLMLGRAETLAPACRSLFRCIDPSERIYQRTETESLLS